MFICFPSSQYIMSCYCLLLHFVFFYLFVCLFFTIFTSNETVILSFVLLSWVLHSWLPHTCLNDNLLNTKYSQGNVNVSLVMTLGSSVVKWTSVSSNAGMYSSSEQELSQKVKLSIYQSKFQPSPKIRVMIENVGLQRCGRVSIRLCIRLYSWLCGRVNCRVSIRNRVRHLDIQTKLPVQVLHIAQRRQLRWFGNMVRMPAAHLPLKVWRL